MIDALTKGIGADLGKPLRFSYYEKKRYVEKNAQYMECSKWTKLFILDVLALSLYNQSVVTPLHGATNFYNDTRKEGVTRIRMGNYHIDKDFFRQTSRITRQFYAILKSYGIRVESLHVASITEFIEFWIGFSRKHA